MKLRTVSIQISVLTFLCNIKSDMEIFNQIIQPDKTLI